MTVPPRIGLIALACRDIERTATIFRALGWPEAPSSDEHERVFGPIPAGFRGFTSC